MIHTVYQYRQDQVVTIKLDINIVMGNVITKDNFSVITGINDDVFTTTRGVVEASTFIEQCINQIHHVARRVVTVAVNKDQILQYGGVIYCINQHDFITGTARITQDIDNDVAAIDGDSHIVIADIVIKDNLGEITGIDHRWYI